MGYRYLFQDSEEKESFYSFLLRRGDTSDSNFDLDGFKRGEQDGGNQLMVTETKYARQKLLNTSERIARFLEVRRIKGHHRVLRNK